MQQNPSIHQQFEAVQTFITETTKLTQRQLYNLEIFRGILRDDVYCEQLEELRTFASGNVDIVSEVIQLMRSTMPARVYIEDPATGCAVPANGLDFSLESQTYIATVGQGTTWVISDGSQLSLRPE
jgi:hypothetical protein